MKLTISGKAEVITEVVNISDKFKKRELVVYVENTEKPEWSDYVKIEFTQDGCAALNDISKGDGVEVMVVITGRKWTNKEGVESYFTSLKGLKIDRVTQVGTAPAAAPAVDDADENNLPF